jgi:hypothetical protein
MSVWLGIFIGSTIGGLVPELWDASVFSYTSVLSGASVRLPGCGLGSSSAIDVGGESNRAGHDRRAHHGPPGE